MSHIFYPDPFVGPVLNYSLLSSYNRNDSKYCKISDDKLFVQYWLSTTKKFKNLKEKNAIKKLQVFNVQKLIIESLDLCKMIKETEGFLREKMSILSDEEFDIKIQHIESMKIELSGKIGQLNDASSLNLLKQKLNKRISKRMRMKRRKKCMKAALEAQQKLNKDRCKKIDEWLIEVKTDIENKKREDDMKLEADVVLRDVNRRKTEARRCLSLLDALCRLREAREKSASGCGKATNSHKTKIFLSSIEKLKTLWNNALNNYSNEEKSLKEVLDNKRNTLGTEEANVGNGNSVLPVISQWKKLMFGNEDVLPHRNFNENIDNFIEIRKQWDQYIHPNGSTIPYEWLTPPPLSNKWNAYVEV